MNILIIGDSFAADWSVKYNEYSGWPKLLSEKYNVTNLAQPGVSEYKIYKQLQSVLWLDVYDIIIVSHTSPYRVHTRNHPIHSDDLLHSNADLMHNDLIYHGKKIKNFFNFSLKAALMYFKYHFDEEYYLDMFKIFKKEIDRKLFGKNVISIKTFDCCDFPSTFDFSEFFKENKGFINHLTKDANIKVFNMIDSHITSITGEKNGSITQTSNN